MADHIVKRRTGRPRTRPDTPAIEAQRARDLARYHGGDRSPEARAERVAPLRDEVLGTECVITGETEDLEIHHLCPSDATERSRKILCQFSTYGSDTIREELRKCVLITAKEHKKIHRRVNAIMREIRELTDLNPRAERALIDYYTEHETKRVIRLGSILRDLGLTPHGIITALRRYYER